MTASGKASLISVAAACLLLGSCKGSDGVPVYTGPVSPATGVYEGAVFFGHVQPSPNETFVGAVSPDGTGVFASQDSAEATPSLTNAGGYVVDETVMGPDPAVTGSQSVLAHFGVDTPPFTVSVPAVVTPGNGIIGLFGQGEATEISSSQIQDAVSFPGGYHGVYFGAATAVSITLSADGNLVGDDAVGCHISGGLQRIPGMDQYVLDATAVGPALCGGKFHGSAFLLQVGANQVYRNGFVVPGEYLFILAWDPTKKRALALQLQHD